MGKFLWASGFVPEFKALVAPLEKLLSPASEGVWTQECTDCSNRLVKVIFSKITLHQADPYAPLTVYPSLGGEIGFVAVTQVQSLVEKPVAFLSRHMTKGELKWG